ncbi:NADPH-dependent FMN reductase [Nocardioides sp. HB32]
MTETTIAVLVGSLRTDSVNRKLAELLAEQAPEGVTVDIVDGLGQIPFYNEDIDNPSDVPALRGRPA